MIEYNLTHLVLAALSLATILAAAWPAATGRWRIVFVVLAVLFAAPPLFVTYYNAVYPIFHGASI